MIIITIFSTTMQSEKNSCSNYNSDIINYLTNYFYGSVKTLVLYTPQTMKNRKLNYYTSIVL